MNHTPTKTLKGPTNASHMFIGSNKANLALNRVLKRPPPPSGQQAFALLSHEINFRGNPIKSCKSSSSGLISAPLEVVWYVLQKRPKGIDE